MCVDYTNPNKACTEDPYPLPSIDGLEDVPSGFWFLSFMDAYLGYNQILLQPLDEEKMALTPTANYYYMVMLFGLKNVGAMYQSLMNESLHRWRVGQD